MKKFFFNRILDKKTIIVIFTLLALIASIQSLSLGKKTFDNIEYNHYNNYTIFESSYFHLINTQDLYNLYPNEHWDLYKYTPTFSVFFGLFSYLPDWLGLNLWNLLNSLVLVFSIYTIPKISLQNKGLILLIIIPELMTSILNSQSNALIVGLLIFAFGLLEKKNYLIAVLLIVLSIYIKLFGIVGFVLFLFYPQKIRLIAYSILWSIILFVVPLAFISFNQYGILLTSYGNLLTNDHTISYGYSVMGWLYTWFGFDINKNIIVLVGLIILLLPLYKFRNNHDYVFRFMVLTSVLIWVVIFNHKAESPTFIIAMTGISIWFVNSKKTNLNVTLFVSAFILTSLSPTDIFPKFIRDEYVRMYALKAVPCIFIWIKIIYDMLVFKRDKTNDVIILT